ncbi:MAG: ATP-binding protein [Gemmatimonadetes bacterium]|nr:ATP-binding protein [Gemmatimonadota bacterium]
MVSEQQYPALTWAPVGGRRPTRRAEARPRGDGSAPGTPRRAHARRAVHEPDLGPRADAGHPARSRARRRRPLAIFSGPPGRGKTHLAVAVAYRAIQNGFEAFFTSADELIGALSHAALTGRLEAALEPYVHPHVLVIDELGYQSYAADAANVLFRVVSIRHLKRRSTIVTTNKPLAALG